MHDSQWLAMTVGEAIRRLEELDRPVFAVNETTAPARDQGDHGLWRVVKVQESADGVTLIAAWQPTIVAVDSDVELGS
jgi:hypothetical protein